MATLKNKLPPVIVSDSTKWNILRVLASEDLNLSQLSRRVGITYRNLYDHINTLEKLKLIKIKIDKKSKHHPSKFIINERLREEIQKIDNWPIYEPGIVAVNKEDWERFKGESKSSDIAKHPRSIDHMNILLDLIINKYNGSITDRELRQDEELRKRLVKQFKKEGFDDKEVEKKMLQSFSFGQLLRGLLRDGFLEERYKVTTRGKYFVKKKI